MELTNAKKRILWKLGIPFLTLGLVGAKVLWISAPAASPNVRPYVHPAARRVIEHRTSADKLAASGQHELAKSEYERLLSSYKDSARTDIQEQVTATKIRLGFLEAKQGHYESARRVFLDAERTFKGDAERSSSFGNLPDQAAYQAAVCLIAQGNEEAAALELLQFIKERPYSPLVHAAFKRLAKMGGDLDKAQEAMQRAVQLQEERSRLEAAVCGPKVVEYIAKRLGRDSADYRDIAKRAGSTDQGTSIGGMLQALAGLGFDPHAYKLNRPDLARIPTPAVLLLTDHYVAVERASDAAVVIYDPRHRARTSLPLPPADEAGQQYIVITLSPMPLSTETK
ncbi:MAG: cysteine peptidase family C39 domain-containing protein [Fimbriimonadaceae bacterium]|nr:MAG: cysteine peptidase family C39 domain-containing protein [Fimbriimonadaceae bacterium]